MHDIAEFLGGHDPFSELDQAELERLAARTEVEFHAAGATIVPQGEQPEGRIRVVRRGSVELLDEGRPVDLLGEGEMFGHPSALSGLPTILESRAREDTLTYALMANDVIPLLGRPSGIRFVARSLLERQELRTGRGIEAPPSAVVAQQRAADLVRRPAVTCSPEISLRDAARLMNDREVSSVLVELGGGEFGIVTDRDLRSHVVAGELSPDDPVSVAMSAPVVGVEADETGADVILAMLDHDIRHVPVFSSQAEPLGVVAGLDLVAAETRSPFVLRRAISGAASKDELREAADRLKETVVALYHANLTAAQVSEVISVVADALIRRMIELGIETEGPPPADFAWVALGSHGRREPVPSSDVDSGAVWRDGEAAAGYMNALAEDVASCIRVLGWRLDPHGVTASGRFSASSIEDWRRSIASWLEHPSDNRVLIAISILLDGRVVYGDADLDVKPFLFESGNREAPLRWMLDLALTSKPPTGFLHDVVVEHAGEHRGTFDIKHGCLLPIVDLARYAALSAEIRLTPTVERLRASAGEGVLNQTQARVLEESYELFTAVRLEHQVSQLEAGADPDDHIDPSLLTPLTRRYLRDAFRELAAIQRTLSGRLVAP
jgi:CBS domain-containing protein